jgi:hypothetical protein
MYDEIKKTLDKFWREQWYFLKKKKR